MTTDESFEAECIEHDREEAMRTQEISLERENVRMLHSIGTITEAQANEAMNMLDERRVTIHTSTTVLAEYEAMAKRGTVGKYAAYNRDSYMCGAMSVDLANTRNENARLKERLACAEHRLSMQRDAD